MNVFDGRNSFCQKISSLLTTHRYSDVTILVDGIEFQAHRNILGLKSEFFATLFGSDFVDSKRSKIEILEVPGIETGKCSTSFELMLEMIYANYWTFDGMDVELAFGVYKCCNFFGVLDVLDAVLTYLIASIDNHTIRILYEDVIEYNFHLIRQQCVEFLSTVEVTEENRSIIKSFIKFDDEMEEKFVKYIIANWNALAEEYFLTLDLETVKKIVQSNNLLIPEVDVFKTLVQWADKNDYSFSDFDESIIRWNDIDMKEYFAIVKPSGLVSPEKFMKRIESKAVSSKLSNPRCSYLYDDRIIGYKLITGYLMCNGRRMTEEHTTDLLLSNDAAHKYIVECSNRASAKVTFDIGATYVFNTIQLKVRNSWNPPQSKKRTSSGKRIYGFGYKVCVSLNNDDWTTIVDYSNCFCIDIQYLTFDPQIARYIAIIPDEENRKYFGCYLEDISYKDNSQPGINSHYSIYVQDIGMTRFYYDESRKVETVTGSGGREINTKTEFITIQYCQPVMLKEVEIITLLTLKYNEIAHCCVYVNEFRDESLKPVMEDNFTESNGNSNSTPSSARSAYRLAKRFDVEERVSRLNIYFKRFACDDEMDEGEVGEEMDTISVEFLSIRDQLPVKSE